MLNLRRLLFLGALTLTLIHPSVSTQDQLYDPPTDQLRDENFTFDFNIGLGFLYFQQIKGNLTPSPKSLFPQFSGATFKNVDSFSYNKTPTFEVAPGYQFLSFLNTSLSFQWQTNISLETPFQSGRGQSPVWANFSSNLQLYGLMLKPCLSLPEPLYLGSWQLSPYLKLGVGISWQSYTGLILNEVYLNSGQYQNAQVHLRQKAVANAMWSGDLGLSIGPQSSQLAICVGCKYLSWGQMRNLGKLSQQGSSKVVSFKPISCKNIYSFAPYIGIRFGF